MLQAIIGRLLPRHAEWQEHYVSRPVSLISGGASSGLLMRRLVCGQWQYRRASPDEEFEAIDRAAW